MTKSTKKAVLAAAPSDQPIAADQLVPDGEYMVNRVSDIRPSPDNRKRFDEGQLQELAASIKAMGVAQPILVRPVTPTEAQPEPFEIVAGERRWRASRIAGNVAIPTMVRSLSDLQAAKIRILENLQREDPHPMEEAEGYELLMQQHGYNADQLAEEIKKSRAYVYGRLKLCALTSLVRQPFLENKLSASTALIIARIAVPHLQLQAFREIMREENPNWGAMSHREAVSHIKSRYMLDLTQATFLLTDAKLITAAGSCVQCPKRAGNQPEVFADVSSDVCTDPDCFSEKRAANMARQIVEANKNGIPILDGHAALREFVGDDDEYATGTEYVAHVTNVAKDSKNNYKPIDSVLDAKQRPEVKAFMKVAERLVPVYETAALTLALQKAGICDTDEEAEAKRAAAQESPEEKSQTAKAALQEAKTAARKQRAADEEAYRVGLYKSFRSRGQAGFSVQSLRELTKMMLLRAPLPDDLLGDVYPFENKSDESVIAYLDQCGLPEIQLILVDLIVGESLGVTQWDVNNDGDGVEDSDFAYVEAMCKAEGIDPEAVREEMFPTPIDVSQMQYNDLVNFISRHPGRINELRDAVLADAKRFDLVNLLEEAAASQGYKYTSSGFVLYDHLQPAEQVATEMAAEAASEAMEADPGLTMYQIPSPTAAKEIKASKPKSNRAAPKTTTAVESPWPWPTKAVDDALVPPEQSTHADPVSGDATLTEVVEALS